MKQLGELTGKAVILAEENTKDAVIARHSTDRDKGGWTAIQPQ